jgi:DNA modification methylase
MSQLELENNDYFLQAYLELDKKFNTRWDSSYEYLVNFSQTEDKPIHRWFYYQEGYSPELVTRILDTLNLLEKKLFLFDPFAGSGTTLLTSKSLGFRSSGFEINPFSSMMAKAKTSNYSTDQINMVRKFTIPNYKPIPNVYKKYELRMIEKLFDRENFEKIELLKQKIVKVSDEKARLLLFTALLSILEKVSNYRKGGNGIKKKKVRKKFETFSVFEEKINEICNDLENSQNGVQPQIITDSCLNMSNYNMEQIDVSIFSPPYANCFDPFEVYKIELWIGEFVKSYSELRSMRRKSLTSNLNADLKKEITLIHRTELLDKIISFLSQKNLWDNRIPRMIDTYFYDMYNVLRMIHEKTTKNGYCVIVVGYSAFGNLPIPTDLILTQTAEKVGFKTKEIIIARNNETSSQQHALLGKYKDYLRESIVVLQK